MLFLQLQLIWNAIFNTGCNSRLIDMERATLQLPAQNYHQGKRRKRHILPNSADNEVPMDPPTAEEVFYHSRWKVKGSVPTLDEVSNLTDKRY